MLIYGNGSEGDQLIGDSTCISGYSVFTLQIFCIRYQCVGVFMLRIIPDDEEIIKIEGY